MSQVSGHIAEQNKNGGAHSPISSVFVDCLEKDRRHSVVSKLGHWHDSISTFQW